MLEYSLNLKLPTFPSVYLIRVWPSREKASEVTVLKWLSRMQTHLLVRRSQIRIPHSIEEEKSCSRLMSGWNCTKLNQAKKKNFFLIYFQDLVIKRTAPTYRTFSIYIIESFSVRRICAPLLTGQRQTSLLDCVCSTA